MLFSQAELNNNSTFYTDSNGLFMIERRTNFKEKDENHTNVASNMYPITSMVYIKDHHS